MPRFTPCLFERRILSKPWGGRALEATLGIALPPDDAIGETWELFDRPDGSSRLRGSTQSLGDLLAEDATAVLGEGVAAGYGGRFPLLVKYIDAADRLSVQVHPGCAQARAEGDGAKTEAWVVLATGPRARIVCGLTPGVTAEQFAQVAATADVEALLHGFRPRVGDVIYVPHGTVHALGPDVVLLEIQQNSDVTYRLYDWGRPRETHRDAGLQALRPTAASQILHPGTVDGVLLDQPEFLLQRWSVARPRTIATGGSFGIASVIAGGGRVAWDGGECRLQSADTLLVPACVDAVRFVPEPSLQIIWTAPGRQGLD